jgi:hypothetical protein
MAGRIVAAEGNCISAVHILTSAAISHGDTLRNVSVCRIVLKNTFTTLERFPARRRIVYPAALYQYSVIGYNLDGKISIDGNDYQFYTVQMVCVEEKEWQS